MKNPSMKKDHAKYDPRRRHVEQRPGAPHHRMDHGICSAVAGHRLQNLLDRMDRNNSGKDRPHMRLGPEHHEQRGDHALGQINPGPRHPRVPLPLLQDAKKRM